ncbi:ParA family protein [Propionivibrio sp.]|uniref:ParA family protein n=1 Tax=Propionivibrio sp. TaxID=2212460 RepID=UPI003BF2DEE3
MHIIAISNRKGGTGKTTVSVNLAAELAALGQRVLLIDLDSQGHCAIGLGLKPKPDEASVLPLAPNLAGINLKKAVDHSEHGEHGEHGEKTMTYTVFMLHPLGERLNPEKLCTPRVFASQQLFALLAVPLQGGFALSPWFELRFLGLKMNTRPGEP